MSDFDFKTTSFEVRGFKDLYKLLDHLPEVAKTEAMEPLLVEALTPMRDTARYLAPDDPLTGPPWNLPTSIEVSTRQRTGRSKSDRALGKYDARAYMGPTKYGYPQAMFQEFGTIKMVATPYMRPAYDADKTKALEIIKEGFAKRIEATLQKYGSRKLI
jgi:HK97 gp10 family phage protein